MQISVNWTCEGLKHVRQFFCKISIALCELNLWGIETIKNLITQGVLGACELNLWGIETEIVWFWWKGERDVWIEPVRDWNFHNYVFFLKN